MINVDHYGMDHTVIGLAVQLKYHLMKNLNCKFSTQGMCTILSLLYGYFDFSNVYMSKFFYKIHVGSVILKFQVTLG